MSTTNLHLLTNIKLVHFWLQFFPNFESTIWLFSKKVYSYKTGFHWVKWLRMQGHHLPATLEVTGSNPDPGKINLIKIEKTHQWDS